MKADAGYNRALAAMEAAAREWQRENMLARPSLNLQPPGIRLPPGKGVLIGTLHEAIPWLGKDAATRDLLRTLNGATGGRGTILQAQAVIAAVFGEPN